MTDRHTDAVGTVHDVRAALIAATEASRAHDEYVRNAVSMHYTQTSQDDPPQPTGDTP